MLALLWNLMAIIGVLAVIATAVDYIADKKAKEQPNVVIIPSTDGDLVLSMEDFESVKRFIYMFGDEYNTRRSDENE